MKYCPNCGNLLDNNKCVCGFIYDQPNEDTKEETNHLFNEPGMREMNNQYHEINIPKQPYYADEIFQSMHNVKGSKVKKSIKNKTDKEIKELLGDIHFTA